MKRIIITIATCDNKYLDIFKAFLMSLRLNAGHNYPLRAILVNGNDNIFSRLKRIYPAIQIEPVTLPHKDWTKDENLIDIIRLRPQQMMNTLNEDWDQVLSLDCDSLVMKSLDNIWDGVVPGSIKIWERKHESGIMIQGGVYILGNSEYIKKLYMECVDILKKPFALKFGQICLYLLYKKYSEHIKHIQLDNSYNDKYCRADSFIWHCKHKNVIKNRAFAKYVNKYYKNAEEIYRKG